MHEVRYREGILYRALNKHHRGYALNAPLSLVEQRKYIAYMEARSV